MLSAAVAAMLFLAGCDQATVSDAYTVPDFEYVTIDAQEIESLEALAASGSQAQEPTFEFNAGNRPVQRFASAAEYEVALDFTMEESTLRGVPIKIHRALRRYVKFSRTVPMIELAMVNQDGRLIVGDTLYTLRNASYAKRHIASQEETTFPLEEFDPSAAMQIRLNAELTTKQLSSVLQLFGAQGATGAQSGCGNSRSFDFLRNPARRDDTTDMCVADFRYPGIKVDPEDLGFTPNAPGAVVMWNTSYRTWTDRPWGEAYTEFYKYRTVDDVLKLATVSKTDLPQGMAYSTYAQVQTQRRSRYWFSWRCRGLRSAEKWNGLRVRASIARCAETGTWSRHTAFMSGVQGLPKKQGID